MIGVYCESAVNSIYSGEFALNCVQIISEVDLGLHWEGLIGGTCSASRNRETYDSAY